MDHDKKLYVLRIKLVDAQLDNQVYKLYGRTEEEIEILEGCPIDFQHTKAK